MKRMRHSEPAVHVLQWRIGCEIEKQGDEVKFSTGIIDAALPSKRKWDNVPILNQYTKGYLEKECVDWLNKYADEELRHSSPPDVHTFAVRSLRHKTKLKLTCLATGFYPRDVTMTIRKYRTSLPEDGTGSTGIRPNHDGTFQIKKSVEIEEGEISEYDCFVAHSTFKEPIINKWDAPHYARLSAAATGLIAAGAVGVFVLVVVHLVVCILKETGIIGE
ncbi:MHC class I antigen [Labeo rohita]|uniref:MHC class I antigen n=1 Tax=Labeo rohita TaxID=84645 RepID=A0A498MZC2_LABRO|nr:MHC class I antigen [Labeo rohita]RXN36384.1 MHC class I antigen [Labeo rohita]